MALASTQANEPLSLGRNSILSLIKSTADMRPERRRPSPSLILFFPLLCVAVMVAHNGPAARHVLTLSLGWFRLLSSLRGGGLSLISTVSSCTRCFFWVFLSWFFSRSRVSK